MASQDPDAIRWIELHDLPQVAERFGLGRVRETVFLPSGLMNLNWRVAGERGTAAVKRLMDKSAETPERSLQVVALLADEGVPVARPMVAPGGRGVVAIDDHRYCASFWVDGEQPPGAELTLAQAMQLGAVLGRIHTVLGPLARTAGLPEPDGPLVAQVADVQSALSEADRFLAVIGAVSGPEEFDLAVVPTLHRRKELLQRYADQRPAEGVPVGPAGWTHGDFQPLNLLWRDGAVAAVLDWDRIAVRTFGEELVRSGNYLFLAGDGRGLDLERIAAFTAGYRSAAPAMSRAESDDAVERMWWRRLTESWILQFHYDRGDSSCDHLYQTSCLVLEWWTARRALVCEAFAAGL
jgi:Ser/Thr protein kinase RdoA (MazF antagonist)